jgi:hypothetical protein
MRTTAFAPALLFLSAFAVARVARAEEPAHPAVGLVVTTDPTSRLLDPDRVRRAVAEELESPVELAPAQAGGSVVVREIGGRALVSFDSLDGRRREHGEIPLPNHPDRAARDVALLVLNLVRDQTGPASEKAARGCAEGSSVAGAESALTARSFRRIRLFFFGRIRFGILLRRNVGGRRIPVL